MTKFSHLWWYKENWRNGTEWNKPEKILDILAHMKKLKYDLIKEKIIIPEDRNYKKGSSGMLLHNRVITVPREEFVKFLKQMDGICFIHHLYAPNYHILILN